MEALGYKIEMLRERMHEIALEKGISHPDVLVASQKLDKAINELLRLGRYSVY